MEGNSHSKIASIKKPEDARERYWREREAAEAKQKPIDTRLSCLQAAAIIISRRKPGNIVLIDAWAEGTIMVAKEFEKYALGGE